MTQQTYTDQFKGLGTTVECGCRADGQQAETLFADLRQRVAQFEDKFSRFKSSSEISALNRSAGRAFAASPELISVLVTARRMWILTDGIVDPTIGEALIAAGYHRSFDELLPQTNGHSQRKVATHSVRFSDVRINTAQRTVLLPSGVSLDFGGIGKGYLLEQLLPALHHVTDDFWLSLGGDLVIAGTDETNAVWPVLIQHPLHLDKDIARVQLQPGQWAVATSGVQKRRGVHNGVAWHHLIDPRTGKSSDSDVLAATVITNSPLLADVTAKTVVMLGVEHGLAWAQQHNAEAIAFTLDGTPHVTHTLSNQITYL